MGQVKTVEPTCSALARAESFDLEPMKQSSPQDSDRNVVELPPPFGQKKQGLTLSLPGSLGIFRAKEAVADRVASW